MEQVVALRPFVPARDFALSRRFYEALGFVATHSAEGVVGMKLGGCSFILQDFCVKGDFCGKESGEACMVQLLVRDVDAWWARVDGMALAAEFGVKPPRAPAMQDWGMKVGFLFDPSGVQWHVAETPF